MAFIFLPVCGNGLIGVGEDVIKLSNLYGVDIADFYENDPEKLAAEVKKPNEVSATTFVGETMILDKVNTFFQLWAGEHAEKGNRLFDLTSVSTYGKRNPYAEYGYNRDGETLEQINLALLTSCRSGLPMLVPGTPREHVRHPPRPSGLSSTSWAYPIPSRAKTVHRIVSS
ncbi:MAG: hypothetical protein PHS04_03335 [Tissierellia bacterium]|nr:hypothetical protein [Tissierellia bacterium]